MGWTLKMMFDQGLLCKSKLGYSHGEKSCNHFERTKYDWSYWKRWLNDSKTSTKQDWSESYFGMGRKAFLARLEQQLLCCIVSRWQNGL